MDITIGMEVYAIDKNDLTVKKCRISRVKIEAEIINNEDKINPEDEDQTFFEPNLLFLELDDINEGEKEAISKLDNLIDGIISKKSAELDRLNSMKRKEDGGKSEL